MAGKLGKRAVSGPARLLGPGGLEVKRARPSRRGGIILAPESPVVPEPWSALRVTGTDHRHAGYEQADLPRRHRRRRAWGAGRGVEIFPRQRGWHGLGLTWPGFDAGLRPLAGHR